MSPCLIFAPLSHFACHEMRSEAPLGLEPLDGEACRQRKLAKLGDLEDAHITVAGKARERQLERVHEPDHEVARGVVAQDKLAVRAQHAPRLAQNASGLG